MEGFRRRIPSLFIYLAHGWGRVVPDIPGFCRELVAAPAEG